MRPWFDYHRSMKEGPDIARVAALIGDPARANILTALMGGMALTASGLAAEAGVTRQTATSHLSKLADGGLVRQRKQGRHKYFALANDEIGQLLEGMMGLAAHLGHLRSRIGPKDESLRRARVCYNHLAGTLGIKLFDHMIKKGYLHKGGTRIELTAAGREFATAFGVDLMALAEERTELCRECLDWSERRSHLAGSLGRALLSRFRSLGWVEISPESRAVYITDRGEAGFDRLLSGESVG